MIILFVTTINKYGCPEFPDYHKIILRRRFGEKLNCSEIPTSSKRR